jgi:uncharacterized protein DUF929
MQRHQRPSELGVRVKGGARRGRCPSHGARSATIGAAAIGAAAIGAIAIESASLTSMRRFSLTALLVGTFCALLVVPAAEAVASPAPRTALREAQRDVHPLVHQASSSNIHALAADAVAKLAHATDSSLWIDARNADAPSYGARIFSDSIAALTDLERIAGAPGAGVTKAIGLILGADRGLAEGAIGQARGGSHRMLATATRALASGERDAASADSLSAARAYAAAWGDGFAALAKLVAGEITRVPASDLAAAAENALGSSKIGLAGPTIAGGRPPLTLAGKPEMFYAGSEACPFCGVQRWGMIVALSQFGTFSNLGLMQSTPAERPQVRTFTFFGSTYRSPYVAFAPVEVISNIPKGFGFEHLQRLTPFQHALLTRFDPPQQTPFIDIANRFIRIDSTVQPGLIAGLSWTQLTGSLRRPASTPAQAIAGEAEVLTAEICEATGGRPQSVCSTPVVGQYQAALPLLNGRGGGCPVTQGATTARSPQRRGRRAETPIARPARCGG